MERRHCCELLQLNQESGTSTISALPHNVVHQFGLEGIIIIGGYELLTVALRLLFVLYSQTVHDFDVEVLAATIIFKRILLCLFRQESAFLHIDIGINTIADAVGIVFTVVEAVGHMHIAEANTRTTLRTSLSPPAAYKRAVEMSSICFGCIVAVAYKVAVAVVVAAATASMR